MVKTCHPPNRHLGQVNYLSLMHKTVNDGKFQLVGSHDPMDNAQSNMQIHLLVT